VYAAAGNLKAAIADYTRITELTDKQGAFYNRGSLYNLSGKYEEALRDFNKALEMNSADAMAYVGRANSFTHLGKYDMARSDFEKAEQLDPSNPYLYRGRGFYYERQGLLDLARADYERSASVLKGDHWLIESLRRVGGAK
jgi:tetratricopeptide (TPR) repeat protein